MITYFKTINDTDKPYHIDISRALDRIKDGASKDIIDQARKEGDKDSRRNKIKKMLLLSASLEPFPRDLTVLYLSTVVSCAWTSMGSGTSSTCLTKRMELIADEFTYSLFTSPSGDGMKVLIEVPKDAKNHKKYFKALEEKYYACDEFDTSCKNISRVCYESYDPDIFINELSSVWEEMEKDVEIKTKSKAMIKISDSNEIILGPISMVEQELWNDTGTEEQ